jgi:hypothetical protein
VNRFVALLLVLIAVGALWLMSWYGPPRGSRRTASAFLEELALEPIVSGAAAAAGGHADVASASAEGGSWNGDTTTAAMPTGRSATRWWRRRYDTATYTAIATVDSAQTRVFLAAVRESLDRRLADAGATTRDVDAAAWVGTAGGPAMTDPLTLEVPYATRRRAGWLTLHARHDGAHTLTLWVAVHEGPRPSD